MNHALFPKVELHLHLDCSLSYDVVQQIDPTISLEDFQQRFSAPAKCTDLVEYIDHASQGIQLMQTAEHLRLVTLDMFRQLQEDNVMYAEIRFAPLLHTEKGLTPEQVVEIVNLATVEGIATTGIEARLILCTLRHYTREQSLEMVKLVERFQGTQVAAFDIAGDEANFPLEPHIPAFEYAVRHKIPRTAHAGEASGASSVWESLQHLRPSRIGHGVRSIEDPALIKVLHQQGIHLEVCPTSNVQTDAVATYEEHPINRLYAAGVPLNVNTDCRAISLITLTREYERLQQTFDWDHDRFVQTNRAAIRAAFVSDEVKQALEQRFMAACAELA